MSVEKALSTLMASADTMISTVVEEGTTAVKEYVLLKRIQAISSFCWRILFIIGAVVASVIAANNHEYFEKPNVFKCILLTFLSCSLIYSVVCVAWMKRHFSDLVMVIMAPRVFLAKSAVDLYKVYKKETEELPVLSADEASSPEVAAVMRNVRAVEEPPSATSTIIWMVAGFAALLTIFIFVLVK